MKKLHSVYTPAAARKKGSAAKKAPVKRPLSVAPRTKAVRVGVWDMGAWVSYLDDILKQWNECQSAFRFQVVYLSVPQQITVGGSRSVEASKKFTPTKKEKEAWKKIPDNLFVSELLPIAAKVKKDLGYDLLVSITPLMIAFEEDDSLYYNYFSYSEDRIVFVSTYGTREYAAQAKRPFEAAIASMMLGQMLADLSDKLDFHTETRGCLFDFNEKRFTIAESFRELKIDDDCAGKIDKQFRAPARKMLNVLSGYKRSS